MMRPEEERFVARMARILAQEGLPPVAGRMWAWLLVCDPPEQTAADLAEAIGASRGSISGMARLLEPAGLIHRTLRRGDRRERYSAAPDAMVRVLEVRDRQLQPALAVLDQALGELADSGNGSLDRLRDARDLYAFMAREFPALIEKFRSERVATAAAGALSGKD
jgi:DNA-binding transcriptional regulator GbsR (MarR family)